jgi:hypothetical protein
MYFSKSQNYLSQNKIHIGDKGDWRIATLETQVGVSVAVSPVTRPCAPRPCHGTSASQGPCEISLYQPYYRWDQNEPECVNNLPNTVLYADVIEPGDWGKQGKNHGSVYHVKPSLGRGAQWSEQHWALALDAAAGSHSHTATHLWSAIQFTGIFKLQLASCW